MLEAIVFDFDGLIIETETPVYRAWAEVFERHGHELSLDFWKTIIGRGSNFFDPVADLEQRLGGPLDREEIQRLRRARERELVEAQPLQPGVEELRSAALEEGVKLAVASSSTRAWVVGHLARRGILDGFQCIRCRDDVERAKPAPDLYLAVVDCLGVRAAGTVAIEDSPHGVQAAKAAGLPCVAVPGPLTEDLDFGAADLLVPSIAELTLERLRQLTAG